ncbi:MAG: DNA cytosine methyltransferase [Candidatus Heimdallarchaeota archaeon]|nr:DNA cytosine methyltransferase [Candidatus Heimdallarchaeota archaeon]
METGNTSKSYSFIDLFSGAGGFSLGFHMLGFHDLLAIEQTETAANTYKLNFPNSQVILNDIRKIHSLKIIEHVQDKIDVVLASPPCEPFTSANPRRMKTPWERFYHDPQGDLIFHAIRIIGDLEPDFFIIENVIPIAEKESQSIIKEEFSTIGHDKIHFNYISAEKHGCPSVRRRVFISNLKLHLPSRKVHTVSSAIGDLPSPNYPNDYQGHFILPFAKQAESKAFKMRKGDAAVHFGGAKGEFRNWIKLDESDVCPTVMGKSRFIHPTENRPLTIREQARLLTYPDSFHFLGSVEEMFNQVGESVPPIVSRGIAEKIKNNLKKKKGF